MITSFTRLYIIALSLVAGLSLTGQWLIQRQIKDQLSDSWIVNFAGRQRFQSQQITKDVLLLTNPTYQQSRTVYVTDLQHVLATWERYHTQLSSGRLTDIHTTVQNSPEVGRLFSRMEPTYQAIRQPVHQLIRTITNPTVSSAVDLQTLIQPIISQNMLFLRQMDEIVGQYQREARAKVERLRGWSRCCWRSRCWCCCWRPFWSLIRRYRP